MTDWPSFCVNLATAAFTGGTFIMGLLLTVPRTRWRWRVTKGEGEGKLARAFVVLENVGMTDVTDVDLSSNREYEDAVTLPEGAHKALVRRGEGIGIWVKATAETPDPDGPLPYVIRLDVPSDTTFTVTWHQLPFLSRTRRKTLRVSGAGARRR